MGNLSSLLGNSSSEDASATSESELPKHNIQDPQALKQLLDETAFKCLEDAEYKENHFNSNVKILIMVLAIAVAAIGQAVSVMIPGIHSMMGVCSLIYFALNGVLIYWVAAVEGENLALFYPKTTTEEVRLRTSLPRYKEFYTVTLDLNTTTKPFKVEKTWSVGHWFDKEGHFDEEGYVAEIKALVQTFEKQKMD